MAVRLSINLFDLDRIAPEMRGPMLAGKLDLTKDVRAGEGKSDERADERAVVFTCSLLEAAIIIDTLRSHDRQVGDFPTRAYLQRREAWNRIPSEAVLTVVRNGKCKLNPTWFPIEVSAAKPSPLTVKRII